jgi:acyl-CoA thioester hydrolase
MRLDVPDHKKLVYTMTIPMRWGDMDAMGHMNNAMYFRLFETLRLEWLRSIGVQLDPDGEGTVMVNGFTNYIKQLEYPCNVVARHFVTNPGRSSFDTFFELEREDTPGFVHANGGATLVWVDFKAQKSKPLPPWMADVLRP